MMAADPRTPDRIAGCGWYTTRGVVEIRSRGGRVYPAQLMVCARPWTEAVCSAKIRTRKGAELGNLIAAHTAAGGGVTFGALTSGQHDRADSLAASLAVIRSAWHTLTRCKRWERIRDRHGLIGVGLAYEFTHGYEFGWNPHLHPLWFHDRPLDARGLVEVDAAIRERWELGVGKFGRWLHPCAGAKVYPNADATTLGGYVTKVQEGDWTVAQEMTRSDMKAARREGSRVPFGILRDHYVTGDLADWRLWQEYTAATLLGGNRSIPVFRLTPGLRRQILGCEAVSSYTDEQLALVLGSSVAGADQGSRE